MAGLDAWTANRMQVWTSLGPARATPTLLEFHLRPLLDTHSSTNHSFFPGTWLACVLAGFEVGFFSAEDQNRLHLHDGSEKMPKASLAVYVGPLFLLFLGYLSA